MWKDWEPIEFTPKPWKGCAILDGEAVEILQTTLDDHIIKTQTMRGSPYIEPFKEKLFDWEDQLMLTQDNLTVWLEVQSTWVYLEPIFSSEDIMKQMPAESTMFREVDRTWRKLMSQVSENPAALTVIKIENLSTMLKEGKKKLDEVSKGLNEYLESKQSLFPRFYFLSNDELLEILSETKEPLRVQPHLKKCFEGIKELHFDDEKKIHAMYSSEGEKVPFSKVIDPVAAKGQVEQWLVQVEEVMLSSVKDFHERALQDYNKKEREKWVLSWQGMAVLAVSMMYWTSQAEDAMKKGGLVGLKAFGTKLDNQVSKVDNLVL